MGKPCAMSAFLALLCVAFVYLASGCQTTALRVSTTAQSQSVTEFYYAEILENLACLSQHPERLPYFSAAGQGQTSINDTVSATDMFGFDVLSSAATGFTGLLGHMLFDKQYTTLMGSRLSTQLWTTQTTTAPDRLALMRCAYLTVLGQNDSECTNLLRAFYGIPDPRYGIPVDPAYRVLRPGWCSICKRSCVPKCACKVGYCGDTAVWVGPGPMMQSLADFTKVILDIASAADGGGHIEAQITALRAKAKDLSELLKYDADKNIPPKFPEIGYMTKKATAELEQQYVETLVQLEMATLEKRLALAYGSNGALFAKLKARYDAIKGTCPGLESDQSNRDCIHVEPYAAPVLAPRLNLNLVPVYVNPPGSP
jgi:hypothetical protein